MKCEWVIDYCLTPIEKVSSYYQVTFWWDNNGIHFVLDQHTELEIYSASSLKQQSTVRYVIPLGYIILLMSQPVFALTL